MWLLNTPVPTKVPRVCESETKTELPNVKPVTEIRVTNGTLTDNGDGVISLQTGGGGGGGGTPSGPAGAVQLSDGGGNFTNDAEFNFDTTE